MQYTSTMTSKGQVTIPVEIRRKLGIKPGQTVEFELKNNKVTVEAHDWRKSLDELHKEVAAHMKKNNIKPLSDEELDDAINAAGEEAALKRYRRSLES